MKTQASRYKKLEEKLGEGSYKTVTRAIDEEEGKEVAYNEVKLRKYEEDAQGQSSFSKEIALLKNIDHPYIIKIFDYWFTDDDFVFITELMTGGTLRAYISKVGQLNCKLIKKWGRQILEGVNYLHTRDPPIIHRDIKNENIFVNASLGDIKIGDLGVAREKKHKRYTIIGTPNYMAREMFEGEGYSEKVDIYAFGMALIEMATGKMPYSELGSSNDVCRTVLKGVLPRSLALVTDGCLRSLIIGCLVPQADRYSAAQCLEHHFFSLENNCTGGCVSTDCTTVCPLSDSACGMELSLVSYNDPVITLQILLVETSKFIKFDYNLGEDTLEKIAEELISENILGNEHVETFIKLLESGIRKVVGKKEFGQIHSGIVGIDSSEGSIGGSATVDPSIPVELVDEGSRKERFGEKTLEVMDEIEQEMLLMEQKRMLENKHREEEKHCAKSRIVYLEQDSYANDSATTRTESSIFIHEVPAGVSSFPVSEIPPRESSTASPSFGFHSPKDEQHTVDLTLSEGYESCRSKYRSNYPITQFLNDAAAITGRSEDTAKSWVKILKDEDIDSVFDLKLMVYEDWERLPLTVFSCRVMQNMLYGTDGIPMKEKQLPMNPNLQEYSNCMSIEQFLLDVCTQLGRPEIAANWVNRLLAQDVRTVGELKSLHQDDWNRLGLSVFAYRIIKNIIYKKGRISLE
ncbi:WNK lysine deficient protein kinase [Pancytospora epiphaga]|nr:WNK lysine deficient protein kinase [Pancytospora epiphaga]